MTSTTTATPRTRALWISATLLAVVALFQLGLPERPAIAAPAPADVATNSDYTMLTLKLSNEDLLVVLDGRNETLFVYHIKNKTNFEVLEGGDIRPLFATGKRIGAGTK